MEKSLSATGVNGTFSGTINVNLSANTVTTYIGPDVFKEYVLEDQAEVFRKSDIIEQMLEHELKLRADGPSPELTISEKMRLKGYN